MSQTQHDETLLEKLEVEIRRAGDCTVIDFLKKIYPNEFDMENLRHEQEWENILQKLKYRSSIERKVDLLNVELDLTIDYLENNEEGEFRYIFGDLSQTKIDKLIDKIKSMSSVIMKSQAWKLLDYKEKQQFLAIKNLRSDLIDENMSFSEAYRILLKKIGLEILTPKDIQKKSGGIALNRQYLQLIRDLLYDHFQVELNKKIQDELLSYSSKERQHLSKNNEEEQEDDDGNNKIVANAPKIKQRLANDGITSLSLVQTGLLFNLLRNEKVIFKDGSYQPSENIYKAIQVLTGYSTQNMKVAMNQKEYDNSDKVVIQNILQKLIK